LRLRLNHSPINVVIDWVEPEILISVIVLHLVALLIIDSSSTNFFNVYYAMDRDVVNNRDVLNRSKYVMKYFFYIKITNLI